MPDLKGKRVALTGPRRAAELGRIVEKLGGTPLVRPTQGTAFPDPARLEPLLARLVREGVDWVLLTTGMGTEALVRAAAAVGLGEAFLDLLARARLAARGYKTVKALKALGLRPMVVAADGTTAGLRRALAAQALEGRRVALQLFGVPAPGLAGWLVARGARVVEVWPYRHRPPDPAVVETLAREVLEGAVDAVAFTSAVQVHHFFEGVRALGRVGPVLEAFSGPVVAVSVGRVTREALTEAGVTRVVMPEEERMGAMIMALARYYEEVGTCGTSR